MPDNTVITSATIDSLSNVNDQINRLSLKQLFVATPDNSTAKSLPVVGDLTSPGLVAWTIRMPFSLSTTTKSFTLPFTGGAIFNENPSVTFGIQMDNANFGVIPIVTFLSTSTMTVTLKVVAGSPSNTALANGILNVTVIGYH
jgi:hypothetical protein